MSDLRRFLVTGPADLRMNLWAATAMMTNWLEGREIDNDRETWLVMHSGNASGFLTAAETIGLTIEEIHGAGESETYELLVGEPGSGWQDRPKKRRKASR
jgi:hypothetical protein